MKMFMINISNTIKSRALRTKSQFENSDICLDDIAPTGNPKTLDV